MLVPEKKKKRRFKMVLCLRKPTVYTSAHWAIRVGRGKLLGGMLDGRKHAPGRYEAYLRGRV